MNSERTEPGGSSAVAPTLETACVHTTTVLMCMDLPGARQVGVEYLETFMITESLFQDYILRIVNITLL